MTLPQKGVEDGDTLCLSIACASIVAKVARDHIMMKFDHIYPGYFLAENKGYATDDHIDALFRLGLSPIHRASFQVKQLLPVLSIQEKMTTKHKEPGPWARGWRANSSKSTVIPLSKRITALHRAKSTSSPARAITLFSSRSERRAGLFSAAPETITPTKRRHLIASANHYLQDHENLPSEYRIDFVAVNSDPINNPPASRSSKTRYRNLDGRTGIF